MTRTASTPSSPAPRRGGRAGSSRFVRAALAGGLAAGSAFAAATGISLATTTTARSHATSGSRTSAAARTMPGHGRRVRGPAGGPAGPMGPGGRSGPGAPQGPGGPGAGPGSGTITAINGTTLTLRTENGTETVHTSSSTSYTREQRTIGFSDLRSGEIVSVVPVAPGRGRASSSGSTPPQPGTGSVTASAVTVLAPTFTGRVISVRNGTYRLVGPGGQLLTVTTTGATRYEGSSMSKISASGISSGVHVMAEGTQSGLTHLSAAVIALMPKAPTPPTGRGAPRGPGSVSHAGRASRGSASRSHSSTRGS